jgi:hypothetical protein
MKKVIIITLIFILTSCQYKSSNRELTNKLIRASYRKGWYDGVSRTIDHGFNTNRDVKEGFTVDSIKFEDLMEW